MSSTRQLSHLNFLLGNPAAFIHQAVFLLTCCKCWAHPKIAVTFWDKEFEFYIYLESYGIEPNSKIKGRSLLNWMCGLGALSAPTGVYVKKFGDGRQPSRVVNTARFVRLTHRGITERVRVFSVTLSQSHKKLKILSQ